MTTANANEQPAGNILLEVCVGSLDDALAAQAGGADRLELCSALELGGLTPTRGLLEQVLAEVSLPVVVMLRPRAGGFAYNAGELRCMLADANQLLDAGAAGIVFGTLDHHGRVDRDQVQRFVNAAAGRQTVFHRAFDMVADQPEALAALAQLGVDRVLTSGDAATAIEGAARLRALCEAAGDAIQVMPGGGVTAANAPKLLEQTGCRQLHIGATIGRRDPSTTPMAAAGLSDLARLSAGEYRVVDLEIVKQTRQAINRHAGDDSPA